MKKYFIIVLLFIIFTACEKYIDMDIPDRGRKLVVNCLYTDTGSVIVDVTLSRFILDNAEFTRISGARVVIFENNIPVDTLTEILPGKYQTYNYIPSINSPQKIEISYEDYFASATSTLPKPVHILFSDTSVFQSEFSESLRIKLKINDPAGESNYYLIGFEMKNPYYENEHYNQGVYFYTDEPYIENYHFDYGIFSDKLFNGQSQFLTFDIDLYHFSEDSNTLYFKLLSISKEMYLYLLTLAAQQQTYDSFFAEPVMVFNNIENGFGIFAGYTIHIDSVIIPKLIESWEFEKNKN